MTIIEGSTHTSRAQDAYDVLDKCMTQAKSILQMLPHAEGSDTDMSTKVVSDVVSAVTDLMDKAKDAADMMLSEVVD